MYYVCIIIHTYINKYINNNILLKENQKEEIEKKNISTEFLKKLE